MLRYHLLVNTKNYLQVESRSYCDSACLHYIDSRHKATSGQNDRATRSESTSFTQSNELTRPIGIGESSNIQRYHVQSKATTKHKQKMKAHIKYVQAVILVCSKRCSSDCSPTRLTAIPLSVFGVPFDSLCLADFCLKYC